MVSEKTAPLARIPLARIKSSGEGLRSDGAEANTLAGMARVLHPMWAVRFLKCWEDAARRTPHVDREPDQAHRIATIIA
jgi:hypothetical protein